MELYKLIFDNLFEGRDIFKQQLSQELFEYLASLITDKDIQVTYVNDISLINGKMIFQLLVNDFSQSKDWNTDRDPWIEIIFDIKKDKISVTGVQQ